jgi:hypothetical protein
MSEWDRQTTPGGVEGPQWVSAAEAADVAGVTPGTVRYWARNGLIVSEVVEGPAGEKTLVRLDEVLQHARQEAPRDARPGGGPAPVRSPAPPAQPGGDVVTDLPARTSELAPILKSIPEIMAQLTAATDRAARAETKVEFLTAQLTDLRRRLAEGETGGDADAAVVLPEVWEEPEDPVETLAEEVPDPAPPAAGWPAPPAEALGAASVPAPVDPGPEAIDWTSRDSSAGVDEVEAAPVEEPPAVAAPTDTGDLSLDDIWNRPATPTVVTPVDPGPQTGGEVDWHEPATESPVERPATTRAANAPVPDGDDFYGPRRRRWFRRKR